MCCPSHHSGFRRNDLIVGQSCFGVQTFISVSSGPLKYSQAVSIGPHLFQSDNQAMSAGMMRVPTRTSCSWPPWEHARTSLFRCMPTGISGLFRGCKPPCHMRESLLRILLTLTRRLEWWIGSKWRSCALTKLPQFTQFGLDDSRGCIHESRPTCRVSSALGI